MGYYQVFNFWVISISWSIVFLIIIAIYLYKSTRVKSEKSAPRKRSHVDLAKDQAIIWFLLGLLAFYIISVEVGSDTLFAVGNIAVEVMLVVYVWKNQKKAE
jgi:Na+/H+ antiporter NhaD/arsenite permease-like protein